MEISVLIPTYCRPNELANCLKGLKNQTRLADEIILVVRDTDNKTWDFLEKFDRGSLPIKIAKVTVPGQVPALNLGIKLAEGDIVAITDDDAIPRKEWLERIEAHFLADEKVGGVGGRDWVHLGQEVMTENRAVVGKILWYGKCIGNHHLGFGEPREVDFLKGANMSYRCKAISDLTFDQRLRGKGAQVGNDQIFSINIKKLGWKLIYDPLVEVDHYPAQRFDEDQRETFNRIAHINHIHNYTLLELDYFAPINRLVFLLWSILVGTRVHRGLVQFIRFLPREGVLAWEKLSFL